MEKNKIMEHISNADKAIEIANIYRDRMLQMNQICDNDWLVMEIVNDVLEWKDEQCIQEKQQLFNKACKIISDKVENYINFYGDDDYCFDKNGFMKRFKEEMKGE